MGIFHRKTKEEKELEKRQKTLLNLAHQETALLDVERIAPLNLGVPKASLNALKSLILTENILKTETAIQVAQKNLETRVASRQAKIKELKRRLGERLFLKVLYPTAGGQWSVGSFLEIQWIAKGPSSEELVIDLYRAGQLITNIATVPVGDKKYQWEIPNRPPGKKGAVNQNAPLPIPAKEGYQIRISDPNIPSMVSFSAEFEIIE
ncbi:MAG: hypothetical protein ABIG29_00435 [Candidatus Nealsonbacteria bacterium]